MSNNPWLDFVKQYRIEHPELSYSEAMHQAREVYIKQKQTQEIPSGEKEADEPIIVEKPVIMPIQKSVTAPSQQYFNPTKTNQEKAEEWDKKFRPAGYTVKSVKQDIFWKAFAVIIIFVLVAALFILNSGALKSDIQFFHTTNESINVTVPITNNIQPSVNNINITNSVNMPQDVIDKINRTYNAVVDLTNITNKILNSTNLS